MSHPARGPARSVGIDGRANAACRRQRNQRMAYGRKEAAAA
jgi:hypothetical protein